MSQRNLSSRPNGVFSKKRLAPLVFFLIFPLIGIMLLVRDLYQESNESFYLSVVHSNLPVGTRTLAARTVSASPTSDPLSILKQKRKNVLVWGIILSIFFSFSTLTAISNSTHTTLDILFLLSDALSAAGGLFLLYIGLHLNKKHSYFQKYLAAIGTAKTISISALASAVGQPAQQVQQTLSEMLNEGCFPYGFLHHDGDTWILP